MQQKRNAFNRQVRPRSSNWENLVAPSGYLLVRRVKHGGFRLTMENRPYGVRKQHLLAQPGQTAFYQVEVDEEFLIKSMEEGFEPGVWIGANNWKHPDDPIPLNLHPVNVASTTFLTTSIPAIHRAFASIEDSQAGVLRFCHRSGFLGQNTCLLEKEDGQHIWGESIEEWLAEIHKVRLMIKLYELVAEGTDIQAMNHFVDTSESYAFVRHDRRIGLRSSSGALDEEFDLRHVPPEIDSEGLPLRATTTVFHGLLRRAIRTTCSPDFQLQKGAEIQLQPNSLLGAIYLSLLDEVLRESAPVRRCVVCGTYFDLLHDRMQYCSNACRQKAHRMRIQKEKQHGS